MVKVRYSIAKLRAVTVKLAALYISARDGVGNRNREEQVHRAKACTEVPPYGVHTHTEQS